jgi:hypothetical protein
MTPSQRKKILKDRGITYNDIALLAGVTWRMVYFVVNNYRRSARVLGAIQKLTGENFA